MDVLADSTEAILSTAFSTINATMGDFTETTEPFHTSTISPTSGLTTSHFTPNTTFSTLTATQYMNGTTAETPTDIPDYVGFLTAGLAILLFGTNFAPVKKFETGDGMFFQWILCIAIWMTGLVVQLIRKSPEFHPLCMLGGFLWETGNICVVPIVKTIGLGLGLCIWGMTNLLSGWATGRFGLFGVEKETLSNYAMNDVGVILAVCSAVIFSLVKNNVDGSQDSDIEIVVTEETPLIKDTLSDTESSYTNTTKDTHEQIIKNGTSIKGSPSINQEKGSINLGTGEEEPSFIDKLSPSAKRPLGVFLSVVSGVMYGQMFTPAKYLQDQGNSKNGLDYVFSTFCGIIASSTFYFLVYAIFQKNKPKIFPKVILPGFISGIMWGVATSSWFVANKVLSISVAFPIVTTGPAVVASLLGVLVFREITGTKNILMLVFGMAVTITGSILSGLSL